MRDGRHAPVTLCPSGADPITLAFVVLTLLFERPLLGDHTVMCLIVHQFDVLIVEDDQPVFRKCLGESGDSDVFVDIEVTEVQNVVGADVRVRVGPQTEQATDRQRDGKRALE